MGEPIVLLSHAHVGDGGVRLPDGRNELTYSREVVSAAARYLRSAWGSCEVRVMEVPLREPKLQAVADHDRDGKVACVIEPHLNALEGAPAVGGSLAIHAPGSRAGRALALSVLGALHPHEPELASGHRRFGARPVGDRMVARSFLPLLQATRPPAVILEPGFVTHDGDAAWLQQPGTPERIGRAIAAGTLRWLVDQQLLRELPHLDPLPEGCDL